MRIAFADPPYLGQSHRYPEHPESHLWDNPDAHMNLMRRMSSEYDGWVLFGSSTSMREILPLTPRETRVLMWAKTFAAFKKGNNPAYAWEPIYVWGGRGRTDENTYTRDWCAEPITLKKGLTGAKPANLCYWLFDNLNMQPDDELIDLFSGTGAISQAWSQYQENYDQLASRINRVSAKWEMGKGLLREDADGVS